MSPVLRVLRDAEVEHLGDLVIVVRHQEDVVGLEIAVDDARLVRAAEGARDVRDHAHGVHVRQPAQLEEPVRERLAVEQLHRDEGDGRRLVDAVIDDLHDVGAAQRGRGLRLPLEALEHLRLRADLRIDELDGDRRVERQVLRFPHRSHPALTELLGQAVTAGDDLACARRIHLDAPRKWSAIRRGPSRSGQFYCVVSGADVVEPAPNQKRLGGAFGIGISVGSIWKRCPLSSNP